MARFRLITTGGTIASRKSPQGLLPGAVGSELLAAAALSALDVEVDDFRTTGSHALSLNDLVELARRARAALADGVDGVVITHGTDTMEESAFLLDLVHDDRRPVVLTGAQRPFDAPATDGPANLAAAFAVVASPHARDLGVLLVFDGLTWQARGVRKVASLASAAFDAPGRGPCLRVTPERVVPLGRQDRPAAFDLDSIADLPRVDVIPSYVGCDDALLNAAVAAGARGIVLQAFGVGNASPAIVAAADRAVRAGIPVLVCSRVFSGPVLPLYGGGGGADLARVGVIFASDLSPWQARLLLSVALSVEPDDPGSVVSEWLRSAEPHV